MKDGERKRSLGREVAALHMNSTEFDSWAAMCEIQEYWTSSKDKTEGPVIRNVSIKLSCAVGLTVGGVKAFHSLSPKQTLHIDASGSVQNTGILHIFQR